MNQLPTTDQNLRIALRDAGLIKNIGSKDTPSGYLLKIYQKNPAFSQIKRRPFSINPSGTTPYEIRNLFIEPITVPINQPLPTDH